MIEALTLRGLEDPDKIGALVSDYGADPNPKVVRCEFEQS